MMRRPRRLGAPLPRVTATLLVLLVLPGCGNVERAYDRITAGDSDPPAGSSQATASTLRAGLSPAEVVSADRTVQEALEGALSNQNRRWVGTSNGTYGFITPLRTFKIKTGHYCREFLETVATGATVQSLTKTACRDDDGVWKEVRTDS